MSADCGGSSRSGPGIAASIPLGEGARRMRPATATQRPPPPPASAAAELDTANAQNPAESSCIAGNCVCAIGRLGDHCDYSADYVANLEKARQKRERDRVAGLHLCMTVWRGGDAGQEGGSELLDGAPLIFALCRRKLNQHQVWLRQKQRRSAGGSFRIRSEGERAIRKRQDNAGQRGAEADSAPLCVSVTPMHRGRAT